MELETDLWRYSLNFYVREGVADRLLKLQNSYHCNINKLLFALWAARSNLRLVPGKLNDEVASWHREITAPLRQLRYLIREQKTQQLELEDLYTKLLSAELAGEKIELALYYQARTELTCAEHNLIKRSHLQRDNVALVAGVGCAERDEILNQLCQQAQDFLLEQVNHTEL